MLLSAVAIKSVGSREKLRPAAVSEVQALLQSRFDSLQEWYDGEWLPAVEKGNEAALQTAFLKGRQHYKKAEWAIEFFFPQTAKELNGPPLPEIEPEEHMVIPPSGFQVLEELIYPFTEVNRTALMQESKKWNSLLRRLKTLWKEHQFRDDQVWTAMRFELMRIAALGLSGFDTPLSLAAINEIGNSLSGVREVLRFYGQAPDKEYMQVCALFEKAIAFTKNNKDFNSFDRAVFIKTYLQPISKELLQLQEIAGIKTQNIYAVNLSAASFFEEASMNTNFFTPGAQSWLTKEKTALGELLFSDPVLSSNNTMACVSCHQPDKAFGDGLQKSKAFDGKSLKRNTPGLLYAGLQQAQFYDMRASFLEDQVRNVIESKDEIHGSLEEAAKKLSRQDKYVHLFNKAFGKNEDTVTEWELQVALAAYVRSLAPFTSRFDQYFRGETSITVEEMEGFNLFMGKAKCGTCHFTPLFNGTVPPMFTHTESEVIGTPADKAFSKVDNDEGRYAIYQLAEFKFAFKTPTLRNVAATAPYMHNGVFQTLEEVVEFYNDGGAAGRNKHLENQTLPPDALKLSAKEKKALVAFLHTLTDEKYVKQ